MVKGVPGVVVTPCGSPVTEMVIGLLDGLPVTIVICIAALLKPIGTKTACCDVRIPKSTAGAGGVARGEDPQPHMAAANNRAKGELSFIEQYP